jgi:hypothetical protein
MEGEMGKLIKVTKFPETGVRGAKRANLSHANDEGPQTWDWFVGWGKDPSCQFEGTWWDMICFARNVLASANTEMVAPEFYKPGWKNDNYTGEERPYEFESE